MHSSKMGNSFDEDYRSNYEFKKIPKKDLNQSKIKFMPLFKNRVNEKQLALIAGNLAQLYKDGITITNALELVSDILPDKIYKNSLSKVLEAINQGKSLSQGFSEFKDLYPEFFVGIISIGENTGKLYEVLKGLNIFYNKLLYIRKEIKNASSYPLFVIISVIILIIFFLSNVVPNFCDIYKSMNIALPANCKLLYDVYLTIRTNTVLAAITFTSWMIVLIIITKQFIKKITIEKFIKIKIVKSFFEYVMVLLFSIICSTGINISQALKYCENSISFIYVRKKLKEINAEILKGNTLTEALEKSRAFSKYTLAIVKVHEEGGTIEEGFKELSYNLEKDLYEQINKYLKRINPIFMFIMAGFIVIFILGFVVPLFDNLKNGIR